MKKKILSAVVTAAALFGAYTAQQASEGTMNDLEMENIEALAKAKEEIGPCCLPYKSGAVCLVFDGYDLAFQQDGYGCGPYCAATRCCTGYTSN